MLRVSRSLVCSLALVAVAYAQEKRIIATSAAPAAIGPYSQAVLAGNTLYCSGQIAIDPATGKMVTENVQAETRQVLKNLGAILRAAGMDYADVVQATVFLADMNDYKLVNEVYAEFFTAQPPARAAVQVARLPRDAQIEVMCTAMKGR